LRFSASVSINHLTLNENDIGPYRTFLKTVAARCAPRTTVSRWSPLVASGLIDVVMSDHNPQDVETKRLPFAEARRRCDRPRNHAAGQPAPRP